MGATYGPVTILCALVDLQVKQSVVTKRHAGLSEQGGSWALPDFDRSVNPISTRGQTLPTTLLLDRISGSSYGPDIICSVLVTLGVPGGRAGVLLTML